MFTQTADQHKTDSNMSLSFTERCALSMSVSESKILDFYFLQTTMIQDLKKKMIFIYLIFCAY